MKVLKGILIFIAVVAVILIVVTFLLPSKSEMERSKVIEAPQEALFEQVNNLENWEAWSPWSRLDPNMEVTYSSENPVGEGEWYEWSGNDQVGSGKLTILESEPHSRIRTEMLFMGQEDPAYATFHFEPTEGGTEVVWDFDAEMSGAGKWFGLMMDSFLGPSYEQGLNNLDSVAANLPDQPKSTADVEEFELDDTWYIGYIVKTTQENVSDSENYAKGLGAVSGYLGAERIQPTGMPMSIMHTWEPENVVMELAIPVADSIAVPDSLTMGKIPGGPALKLKHMGSYHNLDESYEAFEAHNLANDVKPRWYPYEIYVTDPSQQPDTSQWVTEIVYPVE